ncbi:hypothetical protein ACIKTA_12900, partial [Hansschlegelia beijingensis]
ARVIAAPCVAAEHPAPRLHAHFAEPREDTPPSHGSRAPERPCRRSRPSPGILLRGTHTILKDYLELDEGIAGEAITKLQGWLKLQGMKL